MDADPSGFKHGQETICRSGLKMHMLPDRWSLRNASKGKSEVAHRERVRGQFSGLVFVAPPNENIESI